MKIQLAGTLLEDQVPFLADTSSQFPCLFGGYGSGKTHALVIKMFQLMDANPGLPGGLLCPDKVMFNRDVYPIIVNMCAESGIDFKYRNSGGKWEMYFPTTKSTVYIFHGMAKGLNIRGPNLAWFVINEITLLDHASYMAAVGRVRLPQAAMPQIAGSGTPEDFNWAYDNYVDKPIPGASVYYADSRKNIHTRKGYVDMLVGSYDEQGVEQYVKGRWVPVGGKAAIYQFDRRIHRVKEVPDLPHEVWIGCDFNVYPMAATIYHYIPTHPIPLWGVDEINLHGADTEQLCDAIADKVGMGWQRAKIFPDAMGGRQRHSAAKGGITDLSIMESYGFKDLRYELNYSVRDQLNACNAFVKKGYVRWHERCEETIRDLERVKLKVGGHELDKSDAMRTHWLDSFKNLIHVQFPVVKSYTETTSKRFR